MLSTLIKLLAILYLLLFNNIGLSAQKSYSIQGNVVDTNKNRKFTDLGVTVLNARDSILVNFAWTKKDGAFLIDRLPKGRFILLITYPDYVDFETTFDLDSVNQLKNFGTINLIQKATLLSEIIVKGKIPQMKVNGDTIDYDPRSLIIEPNSKVEDLLKQISGFKVDQNGKITAYGQQVEQVLLDGEEFFGDDPTLITKNIRGDMVSKIQLYDKKSDKATFTGIDDGIRKKTVNIILKEDKKKGVFGKIIAGTSSSKYHREQAMFNRFKDKMKFSVYGFLNNVGRLGPSESDNEKYGISSSTSPLLLGGVLSNLNLSDFLDLNGTAYSGAGIPLAFNAGAYYGNKFKEKKEVNVFYKVNSLMLDGERQIESKNNFQNSSISNFNNQSFDQNGIKQKLNIVYQIKLDSMSNLKILMNGMLKSSKSNFSYNSNTGIDGISLLNRSNRVLIKDSGQELFSSSLVYQKNLAKKFRTFSFQMNQFTTQNNENGRIRAKNDFFNNNGGLDSSELINQNQNTHGKSDQFNASLNYTEPIRKNFTFELNYNISYHQAKSKIDTYNLPLNGTNTSLDPRFSNDFLSSEFISDGMATLRYSKNKTFFFVYLKSLNVRFDQLNRYNKLSYQRDFSNITPGALYKYYNTGKLLFQMSYHRKYLLPTVTQLQPTGINENPLNIIIGNPTLNGSYSNQFSATYSLINQILQRNTTFSGTYYLIENAVIGDYVVDNAGNAIYSFSNLNSKNTPSLNFNIRHNQNIKKINASSISTLGFTLNRNYGLSNGQLFQRTDKMVNLDLSIFKTVENKFDIDFGIVPNYTFSKTSRNDYLSISGFGYSSNGSIGGLLFKNLRFDINYDYKFYPKNPAFKSMNSIFLLNSSLTKKFLKQQNLSISINAKDLLNQNTGFNRSVFGTVITQENYTTIKRYFLFSLSWDFSKFGKIPSDN